MEGINKPKISFCFPLSVILSNKQSFEKLDTKGHILHVHILQMKLKDRLILLILMQKCLEIMQLKDHFVKKFIGNVYSAWTAEHVCNTTSPSISFPTNFSRVPEFDSIYMRCPSRRGEFRDQCGGVSCPALTALCCISEQWRFRSWLPFCQAEGKQCRMF